MSSTTIAEHEYHGLHAQNHGTQQLSVPGLALDDIFGLVYVVKVYEKGTYKICHMEKGTAVAHLRSGGKLREADDETKQQLSTSDLQTMIHKAEEIPTPTVPAATIDLCSPVKKKIPSIKSTSQTEDKLQTSLARHVANLQLGKIKGRQGMRFTTKKEKDELACCRKEFCNFKLQCWGRQHVSGGVDFIDGIDDQPDYDLDNSSKEFSAYEDVFLAAPGIVWEIKRDKFYHRFHLQRKIWVHLRNAFQETKGKKKC